MAIEKSQESNMFCGLNMKIVSVMREKSSISSVSNSSYAMSTEDLALIMRRLLVILVQPVLAEKWSKMIN